MASLVLRNGGCGDSSRESFAVLGLIFGPRQAQVYQSR